MNKLNPKTFFTRLAVIALCLLATACAEMQMLMADTPATQPPLRYFAWLESADRETLDSELSRLSATTGNRNTRITLIQRALLYSVPPGTDDNTDTAMELLMVALQEPEDDVVPSSLQEEYTAFARIWLSLLEQKQEYQSVQANQLSDQDRIRELSVKVDRLEKQIEALATIEQRLIEREQIQGQPK